jgi:hypothetical protein
MGRFTDGNVNWGSFWRTNSSLHPEGVYFVVRKYQIKRNTP